MRLQSQELVPVSGGRNRRKQRVRSPTAAIISRHLQNPETAVATVEESFWGEMNRREKWDRDFETRLKIGPPEPSELVLDRGKEKEFRQKWPADMEAEKETEDTARREWDARYRASAKQQLLS